jgi:hypothetical protein
MFIGNRRSDAGARSSVSRYAQDVEDRELWTGFTSATLTAAEWTHEAHVRTAFLFAQQHSLDEAHIRLRAGIIRLNERHGLVETSSRGYFETLTRAWLTVVSAARRSQPASSHELLAQHPQLLERGLLHRHYTPALLASPRARAIYLEPDLAPLPEVP